MNDPRMSLRPAEVAATRELARRAMSTTALQGQTIGIDANGQPLDFRPQGFWAVLTADRTGNKYGWLMAYPNEDGTFDTGGTEPETPHGTDEAWPAIEIDGRTDLISGDGPFWLFPGAGPYYVFWGVEYANWTVKTSGVETAWRGGLLSTGSQSLKGEKTFRDLITFQDPGSVGDPINFVNIRSTPEAGAQINVYYYPSPSVLNYVTVFANENGSYIAGSAYGGAWGIGYNLLSGPLGDRSPLFYFGNVFFSGTLSPNGSSSPSVAFNSNLFLTQSDFGQLPGPEGHSLRYGVERSDGRKWGADAEIEVVTDIDFAMETFTTTKYRYEGGLYIEVVVPPPPPSPVPPPPPPPPPPPSGQGSIRVAAWFDDDEDGTWDAGELAVVGRDVIISGPEVRSALTDTSGYADFTDLDPGSYQVTIALTGVGEACSTNGGTAVVVADTNTDVTRPIVVTVPPPPSLGGIVVAIYKDGSLVSRAITYEGEASGSSPAATLHVLSNLPVGDYTVTVIPSGADTGTWAWTVDTPDIGSGETTDSFTIVEGEKTGVQFSHTSPPPPPPTTYTISGTVTVDGSPAERVLTLTGSASSSTSSNAGTGAYSFTGLSAGTYTVGCESLEGETCTPSGFEHTSITLGPDATGRDFVIESP